MNDAAAFWSQEGSAGSLISSSFPLPEEVRSEAQARSKKIFEQWDLLKCIIERYESTIQKRWTKKTRNKRKEVLFCAWPDIATSHRPDFQAFKTDSKDPSKLLEKAFIYGRTLMSKICWSRSRCYFSSILGVAMHLISLCPKVRWISIELPS